MNSTDSTPIIILGMHRSGTSMLSGMLNIMGVHLGDSNRLMEAQQDINAKGFWERNDIVSIHEEVFARLGTSWQGITSFPENWQLDDRLLDSRKKLMDIFSSEFIRHTIWGIKDPRLCRLLPLWLSIFKELKLTPKFIHITRHPSEVALSLNTRNQFSTEYSLLLWIKHILDADLHSQGFERCWVSYQELNTDWEPSIQRIGNELDVKWPKLTSNPSTQKRMEEFISKDLWHNHAESSMPKKPEELRCVKKLYESLTRLSAQTDNKSQLLESINDVRLYCSPMFELIDETTTSVTVNSANLYGYVKQFQEENNFLITQTKENEAKFDTLCESNQALHKYVADLEYRIENLKTLGLRQLYHNLLNRFAKND